MSKDNEKDVLQDVLSHLRELSYRNSYDHSETAVKLNNRDFFNLKDEISVNVPYFLDNYRRYYETVGVRYAYGSIKTYIETITLPHAESAGIRCLTDNALLLDRMNSVKKDISYIAFRLLLGIEEANTHSSDNLKEGMLVGLKYCAALLIGTLQEEFLVGDDIENLKKVLKEN